MKTKSFNDILRLILPLRKKGKIIVATNGCFDILHVGHIRNLAAAKRMGDILIVGINSDASVKKNKGPARPIVPARERAEMLAALEAIDYVFIFSGKTPFTWIRKLKPDIHVKGGDVVAHPDFLTQKRAIEKVGGRFVILPHITGKSTTRIINKIVGK